MNRAYRGIRNLGRTQRLVLHLLADGPKSAQQLGYDWPGITEASARGALDRLLDRGLVDSAGLDQYGRLRTYGLTERGRTIEGLLLREDEGE